MTRDEIMRIASESGIEWRQHTGVLGRISIRRGSDTIKNLQARLSDAQECIRTLLAERAKMRDAVKRLHAAKGRYHTQIAACDLFDLVGLKNERPTK